MSTSTMRNDISFSNRNYELIIDTYYIQVPAVLLSGAATHWTRPGLWEFSSPNP